MAWIKDRMIAAGQISTRKLSVTPVMPDFTSATESGNAISVAIQMVDPDGNSVAREVDLLCVIRKSDGIIAQSSEFTLAETGDGTGVSTTAKPSLIVTTDSEGQCTIAVTDVSGSYTADAYLEVTPLNTLGSPGLVTLDFN